MGGRWLQFSIRKSYEIHFMPGRDHPGFSMLCEVATGWAHSREEWAGDWEGLYCCDLFGKPAVWFPRLEKHAAQSLLNLGMGPHSLICMTKA